jgi:hypothetical protein
LSASPADNYGISLSAALYFASRKARGSAIAAKACAARTTTAARAAYNYNTIQHNICISRKGVVGREDRLSKTLPA